MAAYGDSGPLGAYEYDHLVPLELGGATNDPGNLWPEPGASPNRKDGVEDELRREVCEGDVSLSEAQRAIATDWVSLAHRPATPAPAGPPSAPAGPPSAPAGPPSAPAGGSAAECTVTSAYNGRYHDYDVYVRSNQPDQGVTVTDAAGRSHSWHTDAAGTADVYFDAGGTAHAERVTVHVGAAICSTRL